jgi:4'-phosphopantetheinyl transferase
LAQTCTVDVWLIPLESGGETVLSPDEELRAARFRFEADRVRWVRAHSALRIILAQCTGLPAAGIRFEIGPHGKPSLAGRTGFEFSLSHSGSWAMVAVTRGVPVGVDIERMRENVDMAALLNRLGETGVPQGQPALYAAWTRREARSKAVGGALLDQPPGDLHVCDLEAPDGYTAALALVGCDPRIRLQNALVPPSGTG